MSYGQNGRTMMNEDDDIGNEEKAITYATAIIRGKYEGGSDFDEGMRILQKLIMRNTR